MKKRSKQNMKLQTRSAAQPTPDNNTPESGNEGVTFREATVELIRAEGSDDVQVRMSVSSELPVLTYTRFNDTWQYVWEILDHSEKSIDKSRMINGLVILDRHWGDQVGLMRKPELKEKKLGGGIDFGCGQRAKELEQDCKDGIRSNCSVGYQVDRDSYVLDGDKDGVPVVRAMLWTPYEASLVPVPADPSVGVGRGKENIAGGKQVPSAQSKVREENTTMNPEEVAALFERAAQFGIKANEVTALISQGKGRADLDALIVERQAQTITERDGKITELTNRKPDTPPPAPGGEGSRGVVPVADPTGDISETDMRRYSLLKVVRSLSGMDEDVTFEREVSQHLARQRGKSAQGIIIPHRALLNARALTVAGTSGATVGEELMSDEFIDALRARSILGDLGVQILSGLQGDIAIPKLTASATVYWVSEAEDVGDAGQTLGQVTGTPHTAGMFNDLSRKLLLQSSPSVERFIANDMLSAVAIGCQTAVFQGTGANGQPSAITNATGINTPTIATPGTPTYKEVLSFIGSIVNDNADVETMKWAFPADVWELLAGTTKDSGSGQFILDPDKKSCCGYGYKVSSSVPAKSAFFGDWANVIMGVWGSGIDFKVDDKTLSKSGGLRLVALQDVDVLVRQGKGLAHNAAVND